MKAEATRLGLRFSPAKDTETPIHYGEITELAAGPGVAYNVMRGKFGRNKVIIFDYTFTAGVNNLEHESSIYICKLRTTFPWVRIKPTKFWSAMKYDLNGEDIDFESTAFSDQFVVRSLDRAFAYAFCDTRMMACLLESPDLTLELTGKLLTTVYPGRLDPETVERNIERLLTIRDLIPRHLLR